MCRRCMALHRVECKAQTAEARCQKCQDQGWIIGKLGGTAKFPMFPGRPKIFLCIFDVQRDLAVLTVHFLSRCCEIHLTSEKMFHEYYIIRTVWSTATLDHHITSHWDDRCRPRRLLHPRNKCFSYEFIIRKIANILHYGIFDSTKILYFVCILFRTVYNDEPVDVPRQIFCATRFN